MPAREASAREELGTLGLDLGGVSLLSASARGFGGRARREQCAAALGAVGARRARHSDEAAIHSKHAASDVARLGVQEQEFCERGDFVWLADAPDRHYLC